MVQRQHASHDCDKAIGDCSAENDKSPSDSPTPQDGGSAAEVKAETVLDTNENVAKDGDLSDEATR